MQNNVQSNEFVESIINRLSGEILEPTECQEILDSLSKLYDTGYRHSYSSITACIIKMEKMYDEAKEKGDDGRPIDWIVQNLEFINEIFKESLKNNENKYSKDAQKGFRKFYDHIMLENARLEEISRIYLPLKEEAETLKTDLEKANNIANLATRKVQRLQIEIVSVLGIFTGVVLALSGNLSFTDALFSSLKDGVSLNALLSCACVCGLVLFNSLTIMFILLGKIIFHEDGLKIPKWFVILVNVIFIVIGVYAYISAVNGNLMTIVVPFKTTI